MLNNLCVLKYVYLMLQYICVILIHKKIFHSVQNYNNEEPVYRRAIETRFYALLKPNAEVIV